MSSQNSKRWFSNVWRWCCASVLYHHICPMGPLAGNLVWINNIWQKMFLMTMKFLSESSSNRKIRSVAELPGSPQIKISWHHQKSSFSSNRNNTLTLFEPFLLSENKKIYKKNQKKFLRDQKLVFELPTSLKLPLQRSNTNVIKTIMGSQHTLSNR